jgi:hypothetical protein
MRFVASRSNCIRVARAFTMETWRAMGKSILVFFEDDHDCSALRCFQKLKGFLHGSPRLHVEALGWDAA